MAEAEKVTLTGFTYESWRWRSRCPRHNVSGWFESVCIWRNRLGRSWRRTLHVARVRLGSNRPDRACRGATAPAPALWPAYWRTYWV